MATNTRTMTQMIINNTPVISANKEATTNTPKIAIKINNSLITEEVILNILELSSSRKDSSRQILMDCMINKTPIIEGNLNQNSIMHTTNTKKKKTAGIKHERLLINPITCPN
jgi:hypothetical protein